MGEDNLTCKNMKIPSILLIIILLIGCKAGTVEKSAEVIAFKGFTLEAPSDWRAFSAQGIDSQVGGITNGKDELKYDLGWYSYDFKNEKEDTHIRTNTTVDGLKALIVKPKKKGEGIIGIYIEIDSINSFNLFGISKNEDEIIEIFKSVKIL